MPFRIFTYDPRLRPTIGASALVRVRLAQARKSLPARPMCVYPAEVAHTAQKTNQSAARIDANSRGRNKLASEKEAVAAKRCPLRPSAHKDDLEARRANNLVDYVPADD